MVMLLIYETSLILHRLYNTVTDSVQYMCAHNNNIGMSVDIAVGGMQGSIA